MGCGRFEDLVAWQKARALAAAIYERTREGELARDRGLRDQLQRAAVSVMSNIAEGYERTGTAELAHFLSHAKGSCAEIRSQLYLAADIGYLSVPDARALIEQTNEVGRLIHGLQSAIVKNKDDKR